MEENCNTNSCNNCEECKKALIFGALVKIVSAAITSFPDANKDEMVKHSYNLAVELYNKVYGK